MSATATHSRYYDHGYSAWQCVECDNSADYCEHEGVTVGTEMGATLAGRWPLGLPGKHPAFMSWAATPEGVATLEEMGL